MCFYLCDDFIDPHPKPNYMLTDKKLVIFEFRVRSVLRSSHPGDTERRLGGQLKKMSDGPLTLPFRVVSYSANPAGDQLCGYHLC